MAASARRQVKDLDNAITGKAVDALLNYETVSLYGNEGLEVRQYDASLTQYQVREGGGVWCWWWWRLLVVAGGGGDVGVKAGMPGPGRKRCLLQRCCMRTAACS